MEGFALTRASKHWSILSEKVASGSVIVVKPPASAAIAVTYSTWIGLEIVNQGFLPLGANRRASTSAPARRRCRIGRRTVRRRGCGWADASCREQKPSERWSKPGRTPNFQLHGGTRSFPLFRVFGCGARVRWLAASPAMAVASPIIGRSAARGPARRPSGTSLFDRPFRRDRYRVRLWHLDNRADRRTGPTHTTATRPLSIAADRTTVRHTCGRTHHQPASTAPARGEACRPLLRHRRAFRPAP